MVIAYLLKTHQISQHMSSYQILRIFWQFLGAQDLRTFYVLFNVLHYTILNEVQYYLTATKDLTTNGVSLADGKTFVDDRMVIYNCWLIFI